MSRISLLSRLLGGAVLALLLTLGAALDIRAQTRCDDPWVVDSGDTLAQIANRCDVTVDALIDANPRIDDPSTIYVGQRIDVPEDDRAPQPAPRPNPNPPENDQPEHDADYTVKPGDTLARIAAQFGTSVRALMRANPQIENAAVIHVGTVIDVPGGNDEPPARSPRAPTQKRDERGTVSIDPDSGPPGTGVVINASGFPPRTRVTVSVGEMDTDHRYAEREAMTDGQGELTTTLTVPRRAEPGNRLGFVVFAETEARRVKGLSEAFIVRGEDSGDDERPDAGPGTYVVKPGDTLARIAERFGTSVEELLRLNLQIRNPNRLEVGWRLTLPGGERAERDEDRRGPRRDPGSVSIQPDRGAPGSTVRVRVSGFPANAGINVGAGPKDSEYTLLDRAVETDRDGRASVHVRLPDYADPGRAWVFVAETDDHQTKARSEDFAVVRDDREPISVRGQLSGEGTECPTLRSRDGTLYTLAGDVGRFDEGDYVHVRGTEADYSKCMQGTTITIEQITRWNRERREEVAFTGTMTDAGTECPAVRAEDGTLYTLAGGGDRFEVGTRVRVVGTEAEVSYCMQGTTLAVESIRAVEDDRGGNLKKVHQVEGTLTDDGVECQALRTEDGTLYTLAGDLKGFSEGDRVYVEGTEPDVSTCMQGTTLTVKTIRKAR